MGLYQPYSRNPCCISDATPSEPMNNPEGHHERSKNETWNVRTHWGRAFPRPFRLPSRVLRFDPKIRRILPRDPRLTGSKADRAFISNVWHRDSPYCGWVRKTPRNACHPSEGLAWTGGWTLSEPMPPETRTSHAFRFYFLHRSSSHRVVSKINYFLFRSSHHPRIREESLYGNGTDVRNVGITFHHPIDHESILRSKRRTNVKNKRFIRILP